MEYINFEVASKRFGFKDLINSEDLVKENLKNAHWISNLIKKSLEDCVELLGGLNEIEIGSLLMHIPDIPDELFFKKNDFKLKSYEVHALLAYECFKVVLSEIREIGTGPILPFDFYGIICRLSLGKRLLIMAKKNYYGCINVQNNTNLYELEQETSEMMEYFSPYVEKGKKFAGGSSRKGKSDALGRLLEKLYLELVKDLGRRPTAKEVFDAVPVEKHDELRIHEKIYDEYDGSPQRIDWFIKGKAKETKFHSSFENRIKNIKNNI